VPGHVGEEGNEGSNALAVPLRKAEKARGDTLLFQLDEEAAISDTGLAETNTSVSHPEIPFERLFRTVDVCRRFAR
jgi:hypothetical protein